MMHHLLYRGQRLICEISGVKSHVDAAPIPVSDESKGDAARLQTHCRGEVAIFPLQSQFRPISDFLLTEPAVV